MRNQILKMKIMIIVMKINTILIVKYQETTSFDILVDNPIVKFNIKIIFNLFI